MAGRRSGRNAPLFSPYRRSIAEKADEPRGYPTTFAGDGAAWTTGLLLMVLAGAAYINDEAANVAETVRVKELATYLAQHPQSPPSSELQPTGQERSRVQDLIGSSAVAFLPIRPRAGAE
jgi:hypothetical protein